MDMFSFCVGVAVGIAAMVMLILLAGLWLCALAGSVVADEVEQA